jgi:hypothetical protein
MTLVSGEVTQNPPVRFDDRRGRRRASRLGCLTSQRHQLSWRRIPEPHTLESDMTLHRAGVEDLRRGPVGGLWFQVQVLEDPGEQRQ